MIIKNWFTTTRITGLLYLGLAVSGIIGAMMATSQLYVAGDATKTLAHMVAHDELARIGLVAELGMVAFQVLVALWFFQIFRHANIFAAASLAVFGILGAVSILIGLVFATGALGVALQSVAVPLASQATTTLLLWELHQAAWVAGNLFFGLWLLPMGYLVIATHMPRILGWILLAGGVGFILSSVLQLYAPEIPKSLAEAPAFFAAIGEFWIIGYLIVKGRVGG